MKRVSGARADLRKSVLSFGPPRLLLSGWGRGDFRLTAGKLILSAVVAASALMVSAPPADAQYYGWGHGYRPHYRPYIGYRPIYRHRARVMPTGPVGTGPITATTDPIGPTATPDLIGPTATTDLIVAGPITEIRTAITADRASPSASASAATGEAACEAKHPCRSDQARDAPDPLRIALKAGDPPNRSPAASGSGHRRSYASPRITPRVSTGTATASCRARVRNLSGPRPCGAPDDQNGDQKRPRSKRRAPRQWPARGWWTIRRRPSVPPTQS